MDNIVGTSVAGTHARCKTHLDMESVNTALGKIHPADRTGREEQTRIVNVNNAIFLDKALLVAHFISHYSSVFAGIPETGEPVVFNMPVAVGFTGESTLDGGTEERGGVLHSLKEGSLPQLCLRLAVVDLRWSATAESLAETGVEDTVAERV